MFGRVLLNEAVENRDSKKQLCEFLATVYEIIPVVLVLLVNAPYFG